MSALLRVLQGGKLRANFPTSASTTYSRGQCIYLNSAGVLVKYDGTPSVTTGLALETCVSTTTGNPMNNTQTVVQGKTGSILLGEALVDDDNLSGVGISVNNTIYGRNDGNLTNTSGLGVCPLGKSVKDASSDGVARFQLRPDLTF